MLLNIHLKHQTTRKSAVKNPLALFWGGGGAGRVSGITSRLVWCLYRSTATIDIHTQNDFGWFWKGPRLVILLSIWI